MLHLSLRSISWLTVCQEQLVDHQLNLHQFAFPSSDGNIFFIYSRAILWNDRITNVPPKRQADIWGPNMAQCKCTPQISNAASISWERVNEILLLLLRIPLHLYTWKGTTKPLCLNCQSTIRNWPKWGEISAWQSRPCIQGQQNNKQDDWLGQGTVKAEDWELNKSTHIVNEDVVPSSGESFC